MRTNRRDIAVVMITVDRSPKENYLRDTLLNLHRSGLFDHPRMARFILADSKPEGWAQGVFNEVFRGEYPAGRVFFETPSAPRCANLNVAAALRAGAETPGAEWVLFLEDDIDVCSDFLGATSAWLKDHARKEFRIYPLGANYIEVQEVADKGKSAWEYPLDHFYGTQAVALRAEDAAGFAEYLESNRGMRVLQTLPDGQQHLTVGDTGYDLIMAAWHRERYPEAGYLLTPCPSFVQHVGAESVILPRKGVHQFPSWPGRDWTYTPRPSVFGERGMRVLLAGDDPALSTGFARCVRAGASALLGAGHEVSVLGMNYHGEPHDWPFPVYPCENWIEGGRDYGGVGRLPRLVEELEPDVVVLLNDPWNVEPYFLAMDGYARRRKEMQAPDLPWPPVVGWLAVDAKNQHGRPLNRLAHVVTWTQFAADELARGGYEGACTVLPLGVDHDLFRPIPKDEARSRLSLGLHVDAYIVGVVGRNQTRKRLDLTIAYFADWVHSRKVENAFLYLHVAPTGEEGCNVRSLVAYYDLHGRVLLALPHIGRGDDEERMPLLYSAFDVLLTTTQGEGWGLPCLEAMACGTPVIAPDWSGLGDWARDAAVLVPCTSTALTAPANDSPYTVGGIPDRGATVEALERLYRTPEHRWARADRGRAKAAEFSWGRTGEGLVRVLEEVVQKARDEKDAQAEDPTAPVPTREDSPVLAQGGTP